MWLGAPTSQIFSEPDNVGLPEEDRPKAVSEVLSTRIIDIYA